MMEKEAKQHLSATFPFAGQFTVSLSLFPLMREFGR